LPKRELNLKTIITIAGPNGTGKTTFARDFLPAEAQTLRFINADLIAAGLAPFNPESASFKAGRLMLEEIDECVIAGHSFAFETKLSGLAYLNKIAVWQQLGYQLKPWFLSLPTEDIAVSRVAQRVREVAITFLKRHSPTLQGRIRERPQALQQGGELLGVV